MRLKNNISSDSLTPVPEVLNEERILFCLKPMTLRFVNQVHILGETESTNSYLLDRCQQAMRSGIVCIADSQSKGRGRRGRTWISPSGHNIYLSMCWRFSNQLQDLSGLSLVIGLAAIRALKHYGISDLSLKWPNDVYCRGRKLAGILVDITSLNHSNCQAVIGIGLNRWIDAASSKAIDRQWIDLFSVMGHAMPSRNHLIATLLHELINVAHQFETDGFSCFHHEWAENDYLRGQRIILVTGDQKISGVACGISDAGLLMLEDEHGQQHAHSIGEVELAH